jgi:WD40 repeat protein
MDTGQPTPVQPAETEQAVTVPAGAKGRAWQRWAKRLRYPAVLVLGFLLAFLGALWLTPLRPYATLDCKNDVGPLDFCFSPDSGTIISCGFTADTDNEATLRVWDVKQGSERYTVRAGFFGGGTVCFSPNSLLFAWYKQAGDITLWETQSGQEVISIEPGIERDNKADRSALAGFRFSPDSRFILFDDWRNTRVRERFISFWNIERGRECGTIEGNINTMVCAPSGDVVATLGDQQLGGRFKRWKIDPDKGPTLEKEICTPAKVVALSPDQNLVAITNDSPNESREIVLWDLAKGVARNSLFPLQYTNFSFVADGRVFAVDNSPASEVQARLWYVPRASKEIGTFAPNPTISHDGEWLAIPIGNGAELIKSSTGEKVRVFVNASDECFGSSQMWHYPKCSFSPDGKTIAIRGLYFNGYLPLFHDWLPAQLNPFPRRLGAWGIRLWDVETAQELAAFDTGNEAQFSPDGKYLATLHENNEIHLWALPLRKPLWSVLQWAVLIWAVPAGFLWLIAKLRRRSAARGASLIEEHP